MRRRGHLIIGASLLTVASAAQAQEQAASDIVVTGSAYQSDVATGGARIAVPIRDVPIAITSLDARLIDDRQLREIRQLADNVAGVQSRSDGASHFGLDFSIRGLQYAGLAYNGFRTDGFVAGRDQQNVERVEFLKGPASVLYGAASALSGFVNVVTKTPQRDAFLTVRGTGGQYGYGRLSLDANAPLTNTLRVRLNAADTIERPLDAFTLIKSQMVAPTVSWSPVAAVTLLGEFTYFHGVQPSRFAESRLETPRLLDLPVCFKQSDYGDYDRGTTYTYHIDARWELASGLTLREGLFLNRARSDEIDIPGYARALSGDLLTRSQDGVARRTRDIASQTELRWTVTLGPTRHTLLAGFEYGEADFGYTRDRSLPFPALDLAAPVYGYPLQPRLFGYDYAGNTRDIGAYVQDFVEVGRRWKLLAGVRRDRTDSVALFCETPGCGSGAAASPGGPNAVRDGMWSPRIGFVWQPTVRTTLYGSWSRSFSPSAALDRTGNVIPAEHGTQYEIGLRQSLLDRSRLTLTVSVYDLVHTNIQEPDPTDPRFYIAIGEQRVRGAEAELAGKPVPWIDLIATYAHVAGRVTKSETALTGVAVGRQLPEVPRDSASMFARVGLSSLRLGDTSVSAGVYYTGPRPVRDSFFPYDPAFTCFAATTRVDLGLYQVVTRRLTLQANITNLFSERIYEPGNFGSFPALPFTATAGFRLSL